jgi:microsomal dipeptidase-like Zn-dependent dipeptidase
MEYCAYAIESTAGHSVDRVARAVDRVGPENAVLATDFGQASNPPVEGFARYAGALVEAGLSAADVRTLLAETPRRLLGL